MKVTHYLQTNGNQIYVRRKSDKGIAFIYPNSKKGRQDSLNMLGRLHRSYDKIFWRTVHHLKNIKMDKLIKKEHYPEK